MLGCTFNINMTNVVTFLYFCENNISIYSTMYVANLYYHVEHNFEP